MAERLVGYALLIPRSSPSGDLTVTRRRRAEAGGTATP